MNSCPASLENEVDLGEFQEKEILLTCFSNCGQKLPGFCVCCLTEAWLRLSFFIRSVEIVTPTSLLVWKISDIQQQNGLCHGLGDRGLAHTDLTRKWVPPEVRAMAFPVWLYHRQS